MATLKLTPHYFNNYEAAYKVLSQTKDFRQSQWESSANKGELDQYMTVLINAENIKDRQQFYKDYNLDYSDDKTYTAALYNEILADRTNTEQDRERYITDDAGNIVTDKQGKPTIEKYKMSDYDYYKQIIKANNDANYEKYLIQQEQERKDSMNGFNKFIATTASIGTEFVYGLANQFDDVFNSLAAIGNGIDAAIKGESISDAIVKTNASDTWRIFEQAGLQDAIIDFERRYTHMRDLDGNYSNFGKYVGGVASTLGQMAPSMVGGKLAGSLAKGLGASTKIATTISEATSTLIFYQGMTSSNIREIYSEMSKNNVTPSSAAILANATIKSTLQWAVEIGLAKVLGGTSLDKMVFGRSVGKSVGKSLTTSAGKRILGDFVEEGLEEVFQDTSDFLVDKAFGLLIDENFGKLTNLTWQSLIDSFIIGGLASFAGSAMQIVTTKRVQTANTKVDRDGNVKLSKLNKLASWEYGLNMQSFMQNFATLQEQGEGLIKNYDAKQGTEYATAFTEMYAAFRMITSIYDNIGEERFKAANDILTAITSMINAGKFNSASLKMLSTDLMNTLQDIDKDAMEKAKDKILKAGITEVEHVVNRDDDLSALDINDSTKQELEKSFDGDKTIAKIVLTKDGKNIVVTDNQLFVPINYANNGSAEVLYANVAEQTLVENIVKGEYRGFVLDNVLDLYKQVSGKEDANIEEAIYNLVFNDSFFRIVLSTANKDTYAFVSSLIDIEKKVVKDNLRSAIYSQKLNTVVSNMKAALLDYLSNQPNADYKLDIFTVDEQKKIAAKRWCRNLYARVINNVSFKKLNENDWTVLTNRVNAMPVSQTEKDTILKNLKSEKVDVRTSAMNRIATVYAGVFTTNYDGKIYMPDTTIPNRTFNAFLQENGLTIQTLAKDDIEFRQSQFIKATNNKYTFRFDKQGKLGVYEASTNKQVGFSAYNAQRDSVLKGTNLDERTVVERGHKKNYLVQEILNSEIDDATAAYLSIDDVITDPSLLSEQIQADIQLKYTDVNIENTFLYLRQYFIDKLETTTVIVLQDGSYAFGDIRPMKSSLVGDSVVINEKTTIKQLIKSKYLYGRLADIKIKLTDDNSVVASYNSDNNTIFVNRVVAKTGSDFLTFAFLHEFQHAMQVENKMNIGMNSNWISSKNLSKTMRANIIKDVRKHRPELFTNIEKGSNTEAEIVNDFVYFASGESTAFGIDASNLVDFYPVVVSDSKTGTSISFPWGNSYNITSRLPASMVFTLETFDNNLTKEEIAMYTAILNDIYDNNDYSKLESLLSRITPTKNNIIDTFVNLLDVLDANNTQYLKIAHVENFEELVYELAIAIDDMISSKSVDSRRSGIRAKLNFVLDTYLLKTKIPQYIYNANYKSLSVTNLVNLCKNEFSKLPATMLPIAQDIIKQFVDKAVFTVPNIKIVEYVYDENGIRQTNVLGFQFGNLIRYNASFIDSESSFVRTYLHEMVHYLTAPLLWAQDESNVNLTSNTKILLNLYDSIYRDVFIGLYKDKSIKNDKILYPVTKYEELASGITNEPFLEYVSTHNILTNKVRKAIDLKFNTLFENDAERIISVVKGLIDTATTSDLIRVFRNYAKDMENTLEYQSQRYTETHSGAFAELDYDVLKNKYYRRENGKKYYQGDPNFAKTSLGPTDSDMSLKVSNENERKLLENITNEANTIAQANSNMTSEQLTNELQQKYEFVPVDVLREIADGVVNKSKIELDKLAENITHKKASYKKKTETKKRYVSQKASTGTNLEKYGYTAKYKKTQMDPGLQKFIVNATENINKSLWTKLTEGKLTVMDVMDYFRDTKTIDNETFKLINDSFFQNKNIKTFEQLNRYVNDTKKYYAVRAILNKLGYGENLVSSTDTKLFEKVLAIIDNDEKLKKLYDEIVDRYEYFKKEDRQLIISEKMLRRLWMQYFDGSTASAGYVATVAKAAAINKWIITGDANTKVAKNLSDEIADGLRFEDTVEDKSSQNAFEEIFYSADRKEQVEEIMKIAGPRYIKKLMSAGLNQSQIQAKFHQKWEQLLEMNDTDFAKQYAKIVRGMSSAEIDTIFSRHIVADTAGVNVNNLSETEATKLAIVADGLQNSTRTSWAIVNNTRSMLRTIKSNLTEKSKKRFLKDNADIFNDNLTIKDNLLYTEKNGKRTYASEASLLELESRIRQLSKDVRKNTYSTEASLRMQKMFKKKIKKLELEKARLVEEALTGKTKKVVTYTIADEDITIDTTKQIPPALKRLLEIEFNKTGTTKTKYIVEGDQQYIKSNLNKFVSENAEFLAALSQADVDSIIDFYMTSDILPSTNQASKYSSVQVYLMTYLLRANKLGQFTLTEQQVSDIQQRLYQIVNISAKNLANWKAALPLLDPTKTIIQSLAKSTDIEFSASDVENLVSAISTGDVASIEKAKERMYRNGLIQYKGRKQSFLTKLIKFERMAMLSGPGTAIRNLTSNVIVSGGNRLGGTIGTGVSKLLEKLWPKKFKHVDGQYKFVGTKVDADTRQFIKTNIVDNGFLELVRDGINKYDPRKHKTQLTTGEDAMIDLTVESIKSKIFNDQSFKLKFVNDAQSLILKALSDNKFIDKAALRYFGKMLVEDKVDLTKGLTQNVINTFAEAYKLAAFDYMHKPNFFNTIETQLKQKLGEGAYFMYKQVFPFAAASLNWAAEGLMYSPVGLAKGILDLAKLEKTIESMDEKRQRGENVVSSRFAEYLAKRKIGKGIIGTFAMCVGIALAAAGYAGIDEEDDKYKLFIAIGDEKIAVDISNIFGTQGIFIGIALISGFKDNADIMSVFSAVLESMLSETIFSEVFNSFRYSDSFGDWLMQQPFAILNMFIPNFVSTLSSIVNRHKIKYSSGIAGKFEQIAVKAIPGIAYAFPKYMDPYTGETQVPYKAQMLVTLVNKLAPFKIYPYNVSDIEKEAISVGVNRGYLSGRYEVNGEKIKLSAEEFQTANEYYGKLNNKKLSELYSNKKSYRVWDEKKHEYVEIKYSKMTDEQKKTVIERIMNNNGTITKIYMLTSSGKWKYYTNETEYAELKKLGIKNVYKKTKDKEGFVKANVYTNS